ncbi:MAG: ferrous iron transport protein B [Flavobacteriales bacterium]|nr:MAG: ferrous iron transport protein B [Flavobacteriales bacterium]
MSKQIKVALIGNPNTGKTSIFNSLTGLNQKIANYPGVTVDKKEGICKLDRGVKAHIYDLPGTYSLNASSMDENIVVELLLNKNNKDFPDLAIIVSDVENLKRNLVLFTQVKDLKIPTILAVNMSDRMKYKGIELDIPILEKSLDTKIILTTNRSSDWTDKLKNIISNYTELSSTNFMNLDIIDSNYFQNLQKTFPNQELYKLWVVICQDANFTNIDKKFLESKNFETKTLSELKRLQQKETIKRYQLINNILRTGQKIDQSKAVGFGASLDKLLTHKVFGYFIFFLILLGIFQVIYEWATVPMDFIDASFAQMAEWVKINLPNGAMTNLLADGIITGIGGIVIFIPQIAFLFMFISILEESGYMSRVVFLMDKIMQKFGLSGKSVVPLISGVACAIPAIMATRNIESWKERLITILVTPFMTCAARLPVYLIIVALVIPDETIFGFNYQAIALMSLYIIGFLAAVGSAYILNSVLNIRSRSVLVMEMPNYKIPLIKDVLYTIVEKTKTFIVEAGKIILAISVILWFLATNGIGDRFDNPQDYVTQDIELISENDLQSEIASIKLENSFIGNIGKTIEPIFKPLGYDWKIGIGLITSFAAREVFVGTLAVIYNVESYNDSEEKRLELKKIMLRETDANGNKIFTLASGISLLLFYAFAMQCMSTLAIVRTETNSWKWPALQFIIMTLIAYIVSLIAYQILS